MFLQIKKGENRYLCNFLTHKCILLHRIQVVISQLLKFKHNEKIALTLNFRDFIDGTSHGYMQCIYLFIY
jgi:hypothetical protein